MKNKRRIIVRTNSYPHSNAPIGKIYECLEISSNTGRAYLAGGWDIRKGNWRNAKPHEVKAFKNGIRNIKNIPAYMKSNTMSYPIF